MTQIKVLVVDDSALARDMITAILSTDRDIRVIGQAANGREAVAMAQELKPDIVTMDIEMPVMNGIEALEAIMASHAVPVLVISSKGDARTAYSAVSKGALEIVPKSDIDPETPSLLTEKIKLLSRVRVITHIRSNHSGLKEARRPRPPQMQSTLCQIVAIASSTGGPKALSELLPVFPERFPCPVVIAQHISDGFISGMIDWLKRLTRLQIKLGEEGEPIVAGTAYVSPSERHMAIGPGKKIVMIDRKPKDVYHPSCDILLSSAASVYGASCIGVILTGMGDDGVAGMGRIKACGGTTIAQDEKSSAIFGMPKVAIEKGCIDKVLSLGKIAAEIMNLIRN